LSAAAFPPLPQKVTNESQDTATTQASTLLDDASTQQRTQVSTLFDEASVQQRIAEAMTRMEAKMAAQLLELQTQMENDRKAFAKELDDRVDQIIERLHTSEQSPFVTKADNMVLSGKLDKMTESINGIWALFQEGKGRLADFANATTPQRPTKKTNLSPSPDRTSSPTAMETEGSASS